MQWSAVNIFTMPNFIVLLIAVLEIHSGFSLVQRLPQYVSPSLYELKLKIDTHGSNEYSGFVNINVKVISPTRTVVLHANPNSGLSVLGVEVQQLFGREEKVPVTSLKFDSYNEFMNINLRRGLLQDMDYVLKIRFQGTIADSKTGILLFDYNGRYIIASNFQRTNARQVFPCFDEPTMKAKFRITIERRSEAYSISNTALSDQKQSQDNPEWLLDSYNETPDISPYQVSFIVSDVAMAVGAYVDEEMKSPAGFWIQPSFQSVAKPGAAVAFASLHLFVKKLNLPNIVPDYLKKVDIFVIPTPKEVKVESLGLMYVREDDFATETVKGEERFMHMVFELVAKQWFGMCISPVWWDSQWLLDSLARYFPRFILTEKYFNDSVFTEIALPLLTSDSKKDAEKIISIPEVNGHINPADSPQKTTKGMMLLRMVHYTIGDDRFKQSVVTFTTEQAYKTVTADHFWAVIDRYSTKEYKEGRIFKTTKTMELIPKTVGATKIMKSWTDQPGYPILYVERTGNDVKVSQKRFLEDKESEVKETEDQCWWIPLTYTTADKQNEFKNTEPKQWLGCDSAFPSSVVLKNVVKNNQWIVFNNMLSGLYRVNYDKKSWELIIAELRKPKTFTKIHPFNRGLLVTDVVALYYAGAVDADMTIRLLSYLRHETDMFPWKSFFEREKELSLALFRSTTFDDYQVFVKNIVTKVFEVTFPKKKYIKKYIDENLNPDDWEFKGLIYVKSCAYMVPKCLSQSKEIFQEWQKKDIYLSAVPNPFPMVLVFSVVCSSLRTATGLKELDYVLNKIPILPEGYHYIFLDTLYCTRNGPAITKILNWCTTTTDNEDLEEKKYVFNSMLKGRFTFLPTVQFFYSNFDKINTFFSKGASLGTPNAIKGFVTTMACEMNTELLSKLKEFIRKSNGLRNMISDEDLKECEMKTQRNTEWLMKNSESLKSAFAKVK